MVDGRQISATISMATSNPKSLRKVGPLYTDSRGFKISDEGNLVITEKATSAGPNAVMLWMVGKNKGGQIVTISFLEPVTKMVFGLSDINAGTDKNMGAYRDHIDFTGNKGTFTFAPAPGAKLVADEESKQIYTTTAPTHYCVTDDYMDTEGTVDVTWTAPRDDKGNVIPQTSISFLYYNSTEDANYKVSDSVQVNSMIIFMAMKSVSTGTSC